MANRYAPYKTRYLAREPKTLICQFTSNAGNGEQVLSASPFNLGIVNVVCSATGVYKIALGTSATSRDTYYKFAGCEVSCDTTNVQLDYVANTQCNHATDPNITLQMSCGTNVAAATVVPNTAVVTVRLHFLDSVD